MRDVFSNETLKEINDLIDKIIENLNDNVETVENPLSVSRENGIASIFTATNYDGTQRVFSASDTTIHILLDGNEDAGKSQRRSLKFTIGDKSGVAFEKNDDDTQYYIWWESDFGIDQQNDGCLWFRFDGDYGTDDTYPVKAYYTYKMTGLTAGKTYTITFTGGFGTTTPENFNLGGALIVSELVGQTMTTIAQEDFDSDAQPHSYSVTFTSTGTEVYLKFDFTNVIKTSDPHALVFAVDEFTYTGLDLGVTGAYVWFDGWHLISTGGGGGGTSDLDAIELTYAEYQALTPAEKTDPDKIYFITDYPSGSGVVINPTGSATDTAETIEVDGTIYDFMDADAVHTADIGVAGGVAELDSNGKVPSSQLPTYPTVGNGTITIQKNGTDVDTFTTNQSSNKTVNITMSKSDVGLGNVDNTSDANKPISTATQAALNDKADTSDIEGIKTVTGNPITITDGSETYADELSVDLEPIQSGSGTPSPSNVRPIQGYDIVSVDRCGKNLCSNASDIHLLMSPSGVLNSTSNCDMYYFPTSLGTVTISIDDLTSVSDNTIRVGYVDELPAEGASGIRGSNMTSSPRTYELNTEYKYFVIMMLWKDVTAKSNVQVERGSATTYEPYNGQTVSLQLGNKNLLPMTVEGIKAANSGATWTGNSCVINNVTFTILTDKNGLVTGIKVNGTASAATYFWYSKNNIAKGQYYFTAGLNGAYNTYYSYLTNSAGSSTIVRTDDQSTYPNGLFTLSADETNAQAILAINSGYNAQNIVFHPMIRYSYISDPTFSPYNPTLGGMVYGGQLTLKDDGSAVFVGDRACVDLGSLEWSYNRVFYINGFTQAKLPSSNSQIANIISSAYKAVADDDVLSTNGATSLGITGQLCVSDSRYTSVSDFKTAVTGQQLVYELATPFTILLSAEQLKLLQGTNNVWSNAGNVTLKYQPDNVIAQPKADVQRLRDDVDNRLVGNACRNLINNAGTWLKTDSSLTYSYDKTSHELTVSGKYAIVQIVWVGRNTDLTLHREVVSSTLTKQISVYPALADGTYGSSVGDYIARIYDDSTDISFNSGEWEYLAITVYSSSSNSSGTTVYRNIQLERGLSPSPYEEYYPSNRELYEMIKALQS